MKTVVTFRTCDFRFLIKVKIVKDEKNRLWFALAGSESTFMQYDYENERFIDISSNIRKKLNIKDGKFDFWNAYSGKDGYLWVSIANVGLTRYHPETNEIKVFQDSENLQSITGHIRGFYDDSNQNIWFATSTGLYIYNKKDSTIAHYQNDPDDPTSLSSTNCNCIFEDEDQQIWVGTYYGLNKLISSPTEPLSFERFIHAPDNPNSLSDNLVYDVIDDKKGNLIIATTNGLCLMDKKTKIFYSYFHDEIDRESINSNLIRCLFRDKHNTIWVGRF